MRTKHRAPIAIGILLAGLTSLPVVSHAARPTVKVAADDAEVVRVLRQEVAGSVNRRAALTDSLDSSADLSTARWQAGFVRDGEGWRSFDAGPLSASSPDKLAHYRERRAAAGETPAGQLELADWCRKQGLAMQELAHLNVVLTLDHDGNQAAVLERLGYRCIGGEWLSPEQLAEWRELNRHTSASLKHWSPKLERIVKQLSGGTRQHEAGQAALKEITDLAAIPAMELILCGHDEKSAQAAVKTFARMAGFESSIALSRQAMFSKWTEVRQSATAALRPRVLEDFVPQLVGLLSTPIKGEVEVKNFGFQKRALPGLPPGSKWRMSSGILEYSYVMTRETGDQFQVSSFKTINSLLDDRLGGAIAKDRTQRTALKRDPTINAALELGRTEAIQAFQADVNRKNALVEEQNEQIAQINERVGNVLGAVSGEGASSDPKRWWNWWNSHNDLAAASGKPVVRIVDENETVGSLAPSVFYLDCLAAGTLVWTETGPVAIEKIRVGDIVLTKNIETGELAGKPVLETTRRPPKELRTLRFNDETIVCTGGHRFWISGTGWTKARDIAAASLVHTTTGNTPVWTSKQGQIAETYNLVVADFHTYFVGQTGVLCQDVTLPKPTNKVVPGLDRSQIAAK